MTDIPMPSPFEKVWETVVRTVHEGLVILDTMTLLPLSSCIE
jgi:hypothetical protein